MALPRKKVKGPPGAPDWMLTFTDVISLLVTFFILMLTFSTMEEEKFNEAAGSLRNAFGNAQPSGLISRPVQPIDTQEPRPAQERIAHSLKALDELKNREGVEILRAGSQTRIRIAGDLVFAPGSARLSRAGRSFLRDLSVLLARLRAPLRAEGHADSSLGARAMGVSQQRAITVALELERLGIPPERIGVAAFGATRPVTAAGERGDSANRRVEIVVLESPREVRVR